MTLAGVKFVITTGRGPNPLVTLRASVPMRLALICADCECISEADGEAGCPSCGSQSLFPLGTWLNRPAKVRG